MANPRDDTTSRRRKSGVRKANIYKGRGRGMTGPPLPMSPEEIIALAQGMGRGRGMTGITPDIVNDLTLPMSFGDSNREPRGNESGNFFAGTGYTPPQRSNGPIAGDDVRTPMPRPSQVITEQAANPGGNDGMTSQDMLAQTLIDLITQPAPTFDYESAMQQAASGIRKAYGAEIAAIKQNNRVARKSTKRARKEIENLYQGLATLYNDQEQDAVSRAQQASEDQMGIATQGNSILEDLNNRMIQDEAQLLQDLNAGQAFDEVISPDFDRMGEQIAENTEFGQEASSRALRQGENNARWFDRAEGGANLEGTNREADMISQLAQFIRTNRQGIAGLKGDRLREIGASNASIQAQAAEASGNSHQQMIDNLMNAMTTLSGVEDTDQDNQRADAKFRWDKKTDRRDQQLENQKFLASLQDDAPNAMENFAPGIGEAVSIISGDKDPNDEKAMAALYKLFGRNAWETGQVPSNIPGETNDLTPFKAMAIARKKGMAIGLRGKELSDFVNAAAASVG